MKLFSCSVALFNFRVAVCRISIQFFCWIASHPAYSGILCFYWLHSYSSTSPFDEPNLSCNLCRILQVKLPALGIGSSRLICKHTLQVFSFAWIDLFMYFCILGGLSSRWPLLGVPLGFTHPSFRTRSHTLLYTVQYCICTVQYNAVEWNRRKWKHLCALLIG